METTYIVLITVAACAFVGTCVWAYARLSVRITETENSVYTEISNLRSDIDVDLNDIHRNIDRRSDQLLNQIDQKVDKIKK
tara:strand:- start:404 stop:646 length:243 start_codon:yes stop_codon:yes gene_type:complete